MSTDWLGFATAVIGLAAAIIGLWAVVASLRRSERPVPVITAPTDEETLTFIERTIWERRPPKRPAIYESSRPPIICVANMKGGVGKTTITANLAAHFCATAALPRVMLIDFDYQGSLSQCILGQAGVADVSMSSHHLLLGRKQPEDVLNFAPPMRFRPQDGGHMRLFRATYPFSTIENELFVEWLTSEDREVRYGALRYLDSAEFKAAVDVAIIDCPPRITTATINGLTAATRLLVPTQPDGLSIPGVEYFSRQLMRMRAEAFPNLKLLGVVPSITLQSTGLAAAEREELDELEAKLAEIWPRDGRMGESSVLADAFVPRSKRIRDAAGKGIAYFRDAQARTIFARLGEAVLQRL